MSVQRIWHGLKPHLTFSFKLSNDPNFCEMVQDMSGSTSTRQTRRWCCRSTKKPDPGAQSHPAGIAAEEGPRRHDDLRLVWGCRRQRLISAMRSIAVSACRCCQRHRPPRVRRCCLWTDGDDVGDDLKRARQLARSLALSCKIGEGSAHIVGLWHGAPIGGSLQCRRWHAFQRAP